MHTEVPQTTLSETSATKRAWITVSWCLAEVTLVWWAVSTEASGPSNIVKVIAAINGLLWPVVLFAATQLEKTGNRPGWQLSFANWCDLASTILLAWSGWWWCSLAFGLGGIASTAFREKERSLWNDSRKVPSVEPKGVSSNVMGTTKE